MIENLPIYITLSFTLTTVATWLLFIWAIKNSNSEFTRKKAIPISIFLIIWLAIQGTLTFKNIYAFDVNTFPPKILLFGLLPTMLIILFLFITKNGKLFIDSLPLKNLTYLNMIRIPVEVILLWLFLNKAIPEIMTFEGRNFDIIAGITAPFVAYLGFSKKIISRKTILVWNIICLGLLINIVVIALLSSETPIQKFGFNQPNIAIANFPFSWLATFIVPIVIFGHLVSIRQLLKNKS